VHDLDVDPPRGLMAWVRGSPLAHAQAAVRGKEADAVPVVEALLADARSSARLRRNAVPLYAHLLLVTAPAPTAAELYDARRQGKPIDPYRRRRDAMLALVDDEDVEVAIAAASALLEGADPGELPALRLSLARVLPLMRERRFESPQVQQALVALGGLPDALAWLEQLASQSGPLPPDLELLVAAADRTSQGGKAARQVDAGGRRFTALGAEAEHLRRCWCASTRNYESSRRVGRPPARPAGGAGRRTQAGS
jgi:hypothetical protein